MHRYADDTYYGGGEWVLLATWLGWYYVEAFVPYSVTSYLRYPRRSFCCQTRRNLIYYVKRPL